MGMLMYWTHDCPAPWQTPEWREQMRAQLRPNAYLRLIENRFVTAESGFVPIEWYDACVDPNLGPEIANPSLQVWVGVDASVKRDSTALVAATFDHATKKVRVVWHRTFQPTPQDPLDFSATVERSLLELRQRFRIREVKYDPYQLVAVAQRLTAAGLPMVEFPQSVPNLTSASSNLFELLKGRNLSLYPDDDLRLAMSRAVALETSRGWRIAKEKQSHKIDSIVALAQAALGAVEQGQQSVGVDHAFMYRAQAHFHNLEMARTGQQPRRGSIAEQDAAEDRANDMQRSSNPLRLVKSRRWGRGGY
jgi:phage terminase large subunit-like protein